MAVATLYSKEVIQNRVKELAAEIDADFSNEEVVITRALLDSLEAGYCITLHKAQGSQFKGVIVALSGAKMLDGAWLYRV